MGPSAEASIIGIGTHRLLSAPENPSYLRCEGHLGSVKLQYPVASQVPCTGPLAQVRLCEQWYTGV
jgi:hypothetical protein